MPEFHGDCSLEHASPEGKITFSISWDEGSSVEQREIKLAVIIKPNSKTPEISDKIKPGLFGGITSLTDFIFQKGNSADSPITVKNIIFKIDEFDRINGNKINQDWLANITIETGKQKYTFKSTTSKPSSVAGMGKVPYDARTRSIDFNIAEQVGKHKAPLLSEDIFHALAYGDIRIQVNDFDSNAFLFTIDETLISHVKNKKGQKENLLNVLSRLDNIAIDMISKGHCPTQ